MVFRFCSHSLALLVQAGLVKPTQNAASTRYIVAAAWLDVSPIPAINVQWQVLICAAFQVLSKVCGMDPLLTEILILHSPLMIQYLFPERL